MVVSRHLYTSVGTEVPSLAVAPGKATTLDTGACRTFSALLLKEMKRSNRILEELQAGLRVPNPGAVSDPATGASCSSATLVYHHLVERPLAIPRGLARGLLPRASVGTFLGIDRDLIELLERCGKPFCGSCLREGKRSTAVELRRFEEGVGEGTTLLLSLPLGDVEAKEAYTRILELFGATRVVVKGQLLRADDFTEGEQVSVVLESVGSAPLVDVVGRWSETVEVLEIHEVNGREVVRSLQYHAAYRCPNCARPLSERFELKDRIPCAACEARGCQECFGSGAAREGPHFCVPHTPLDTLRLGTITLAELHSLGLPPLELFDLAAVRLGDEFLALDYSTRALLTFTRLLSLNPSGWVVVCDHVLSMVAPKSRAALQHALERLEAENAVLILEEGAFHASEQSQAKSGDVLTSLRQQGLVVLEEGGPDVPSLSTLRDELKTSRSLHLQLEDFKPSLRIGELADLFIMLGEIVARSAGGRVLGVTPLDLHPRRGRYSCSTCKGVGRLNDLFQLEEACSSCTGTGLSPKILSLELPWGSNVGDALQMPLKQLHERARHEVVLSSVLESLILVGGEEESLVTDLSYRTLPYAQRVWVAAETTLVCTRGGAALLLLRGICSGLSRENRMRILDLLKKFASCGHYVVVVEGDLEPLGGGGEVIAV